MNTVPGIGTTGTLSELYVVYDADGTVVGEMMYSIRKWLGRGKCSACDITHGPHREKEEFTEFKDGFNVPVYNIHRDEMDVEMRKSAAGRLPCVFARVNMGEFVFLMGTDTLERCQGSVQNLKDEIRRSLEANSITVPGEMLMTQDYSEDQCVPKTSRRFILDEDEMFIS
eukprot:Plantae.Rhodophyta-Purpureofilum_apyrenoidigerum.ctg12402.p1 GENE.Plantae.Rhodophyta-Purpureofilum_apyrenoidigerum.ctg12402~~Plantae.Rhodophyta-Purpureofilum_apyrenoidigerum.ctg12402.p1  ORF type:complete len:170 (-),score=24.25 Plantae.Rhodophyta-Purpureofilum_apyrenoidigerum.ctg12402:1206-1715(-)